MEYDFFQHMELEGVEPSADLVGTRPPHLASPVL